MITNVKEVLQNKSLPASLWSQAVHHAAWIKNHTFTHSLHSKITPYQAYFGKTPSLAMLHLFSCKAFTHIQRVNQTKFGECAACCIHVNFAEEKRAYLLYSCEHRKMFESWDVKFEEVEDWERVTVDSGSEEVEVKSPPNAGDGDPGGVKSVRPLTAMMTTSLMPPAHLLRQ